MKYYGDTKKPDPTFILEYKISEDKETITIKYATGHVKKICYSEEAEKQLNKIMEKQLECAINPIPLANGKSLADCFRDDYIKYLKTAAFCAGTTLLIAFSFNSQNIEPQFFQTIISTLPTTILAGDCFIKAYQARIIASDILKNSLIYRNKETLENSSAIYLGNADDFSTEEVVKEISLAKIKAKKYRFER